MLLAMLVAAAVSFASTPMVKTLACKVGAIDVPKDNRRMHKVPIPRMGGLAIFLAFLLSVLVFADIDRQMQGILLGSIAASSSFAIWNGSPGSRTVMLLQATMSAESSSAQCVQPEAPLE